MNTLQKKTICLVRSHVAVQDCLFLSLVVLFSLILYIHGLGFYSDDWWFIGTFSISKDQSLFGLFRSIYDGWALMRPVQILYLAGMYWLFGPYPLGYHLVNAAILLLGVVLFYLVLRELGQSRVFSLSVPMVYALLPHYSTDRFWFAAHPVTLSMTLYFLSLYSDLRTLQAQQARLWGYKLLSILSLLGSTLTYEVFLPLFLLNLLVVWYHGRQLYGLAPCKLLSRVKLAVLIGSNLIALILGVVFKALTTTRTEVDFSRYSYHIVWFTRLLKDAIMVNYGNYVLGLPLIIWKILRYYFDWTIFAVGGGLGLLVFVYLYRTAGQSKADLTDQLIRILGFFSMYIAFGLVVFGLGYAIFLTNKNAIITPTGIGNRIAIAAAAGVALSLVGGIGWVSTLLPSNQLRRCCFCMLVALICMSGFVINSTLASFWITAYRQEQEILADIRQQFPTLPAGSTLILDGVCPYVGPAIVFESSWDLAGALQMLHHDHTLQADVVTPNLKVKEDGLYTSLYGYESRYHYEKLYVYHFGRKTTYQLTDAEAAHLYFQAFNPDHSSGCPRGYEGYGVPVF